MPRTSDKAEKILEYVNAFVQENGYAPSVREIGAAVGLRSTASVSYHIQALQEKGLLSGEGSQARSVHRRSTWADSGDRRGHSRFADPGL